MITTDDLRFFLTLAATSSLAQAARALDVTPPAVTQRLHAVSYTHLTLPTILLV